MSRSASFRCSQARISSILVSTKRARLRLSLGSIGGYLVNKFVKQTKINSGFTHERGFDQAELLARAIARHLGRPCRGLLLRDRSPPQTGRTAQERRHGPSFTVRDQPRRPEAVLLVDDVITTGSTVTSAALAVRKPAARDLRGVLQGPSCIRSPNPACPYP